VKAAVAGVGAAFVASACCIGPVVFSLLGVGALSASAVWIEPYRPWLVGLTVALVGLGFYSAYRPTAEATSCKDGACASHSRRTARILAWIAVAMAVLLMAFPYYIGWFF
jgi:mercuric ion transport protein